MCTQQYFLGEHDIGGTRRNGAQRPGRATPRPSARPALSAPVLAGLFVALFPAAVATAGPAAAIDDPTRPDARVTHGPSCRPGGLVVEVQAGTTPYSVRLATTRQP